MIITIHDLVNAKDECAHPCASAGAALFEQIWPRGIEVSQDQLYAAESWGLDTDILTWLLPNNVSYEVDRVIGGYRDNDSVYLDCNNCPRLNDNDDSCSPCSWNSIKNSILIELLIPLLLEHEDYIHGWRK